jgi:hypothetical protein
MWGTGPSAFRVSREATPWREAVYLTPMLGKRLSGRSICATSGITTAEGNRPR